VKIEGVKVSGLNISEDQIINMEDEPWGNMFDPFKAEHTL
jgi:hypothetical protein